jgi:hypothetical protein
MSCNRIAGYAMSMKIVTAVAALVVLAFLAGRLGIGSAPAGPAPSPPQQPLITVTSSMGSATVVEMLPVANSVEAKLNLVLPEVKFSKTSFDEAIETLRTRGNINLVVNWRSLDAAGIDRAVPISLTLKDVALGDALLAVLMNASTPTARVGYEPAGNVLLIDTGESLSKLTLLRVYDIADIVLAEQERQRILYPPDAMREPQNAASGNPVRNQRRSSDEILEDLVKLIQERIAPDSWRETGGMTGSITELSGRLIIEHTRTGHRETEALLAALRATGRIPATRPALPASRPS